MVLDCEITHPRRLRESLHTKLAHVAVTSSRSSRLAGAISASSALWSGHLPALALFAFYASPICAFDSSQRSCFNFRRRLQFSARPPNFPL
eukprot:1952012-Pleurochrysis_carterae.AAC.1